MPALIVDPDLIAQVTRTFQLRGELKPFNLTENVVPVFDIGRLEGLPLQEVVTPALLTMVAAGPSAAARHYAAAPPDSTVLNVSSNAAASGAGSILADTGQLAAGQHYCRAFATCGDAVAARYELQHRDAADAANLAVWSFEISLGCFAIIDFVATFAVDERVRWTNVTAVTLRTATNIMATPSALDVAV